MHIIRWLAIPVLVIVGAGAVWASTGASLGEAPTTGTLLTSAAELTTVSQEVAATGNVQPAVQYALAFGADPTVVGSSASAAAATRAWSVTSVDAVLGGAVAAGDVLATADTADVEADLDALAVQIADAQGTLDDATTTKSGIRSDTKTQLATAEDDLTVAKLNLTSAKEAYADASGTAARRQARIGVIQSRAQVESAQATVDDLKRALKGDFPDEQQAVADAQAQLADLQRQRTDLEAELAAATLRAPVDGIVSEIDIVAGYGAPSGTAIVIDGSQLEVVAQVVESDLASIALGQAATVNLSALELDAPGTVTAIAPTTSASSSSVVSYPVTVTLTDPDARIRAGMSTDVTISTAVASDVVAVPVAALRGRNGSYVVQVMAADGTTEQRPVTVGLVTETLAEVQSGVTAGEQVVIGTNAQRASSSSSTTGTGTFPGGGAGFPTGGFPTGGFPGAGR